MSDDTSSTQWKLDLDVTDALANVNEFKEGLESVGDVESLSGLITTMTELGAAIGAVAGIIFAFKESLDLVMEAEQIQAINTQFATMAANAGLVGSNLKKALEDSAGGLVDETTLLKAADQAMAGLGSNAAALPEIMTIARQATTLFGGDLVTNFSNISKAIESGNTRMLKQYGIIVDQKKAYEDYAKSIGVATSELSRQGEQHALLNAVLEQTKPLTRASTPKCFRRRTLGPNSKRS